MLDKLEHTSAESKSKINEIEQIVSDSVIISSQENKALKERLDELNRSLKWILALWQKDFLRK